MDSKQLATALRELAAQVEAGGVDALVELRALIARYSRSPRVLPPGFDMAAELRRVFSGPGDTAVEDWWCYGQVGCEAGVPNSTYSVLAMRRMMDHGDRPAHLWVVTKADTYRDRTAADAGWINIPYNPEPPEGRWQRWLASGCPTKLNGLDIGPDGSVIPADTGGFSPGQAQGETV